MSNETAGEHYTPREVIALMVDLLLDEDSAALTGQAPVRTVYDPAAGTGGMLTVAEQRILSYNTGATVEVSGQELNPETWAIARSELMIRNVNPERMAPGNSLTDDAFGGTRFDYLLANPPYGVDWKAYADPIRAEALTAAESNRFHAGLPRISDGSLLFVQQMISKSSRARPQVVGRGWRSCCPARHCSPAAPGRGSLRSAAGSSRTTCSKASSVCRIRCSTTPASRPTSGS